MIETIYTRFYVAIYEGAPPGNSELHEWRLCRGNEGIPRHWADRAGAENWIDEECNGDRVQMQEYMVVEQRTSFASDEPAIVLDIDSLLISTIQS